MFEREDLGWRSMERLLEGFGAVTDGDETWARQNAPEAPVSITLRSIAHGR